MRKLRLLLVAALLMPFAPAAHAQDEGDSLEQLMMKEAAITVASNRAETVFNSVSNVTVIDRATIERFNFGSVHEALETVAGIMVWRTYFFKRVHTFRGGLQEQYANKSLIMINNVPMWHAVTGEGDVDRVPIEAVERIEILRGPASVLYGSNALNGAINIVLRKAKKGDTTGSVTAGAATKHGGYEGDFEMSRGIGQVASAGEDYSYNVVGGVASESWPLFMYRDELHADGKIADTDRTRSMTAAGSWKGHSVLANVYSAEDGYMGVTPRHSAGAGDPMRREFGAFNYTYNAGPQWANLKYSVTYDRQRRNFSRSDDDDTRTDTVGSRINNTLSASFPIAEGFTLDLGGDHDYRTSYRYNEYVRESQNVSASATSPRENELKNRYVFEGSAYGQLGYDANPWKAVLGTRYTHNQIFGDNFSSRGSVVYQFNETNSLKAVVGQAFRAPTLFELYFLTQPMTGGGVVGNPDLEPEKTTSAEISYLTSWNNLFAQVTGYWAEHKKRIFRTLGSFTRDGTTASVNYYTNANEYNVRGAEIELRYRLPKTEAYVAVDLIDGNKGDNTAVTDALNASIARDAYNYKYVPKWTLSSGVSQQVGNFFGSLNANAYAGMNTLRTRISENAWLDASAGYKAGRVRHAIGVRNLTDNKILVPEYVRNQVLENVVLLNGPRVEYTLTYSF